MAKESAGPAVVGQAAGGVFSRVFYGWWVLVACCVIMGFASGVSSYSASVFFTPVSQTLGLDRCSMSLATSLSRAENFILAPIVGYFIDRYGSRGPMTIGMTLAGLGLICFGLFTNSLLLFILTWTMMVSVGTNIGAFAPSWAALNNWFVRKKGQAMGFGMASQALGGFLIAPLAAFLIVAFSGNWRAAAVVLGIMLLVLVVPVTRFVRNHPEELGLLPDGRKPGEPVIAERKDGARLQGRQWDVVHFSLKQAMRTPALWFLIASMSMWQFGSQSIVLHLGAMVGDQGYSLSVAGLVVGLLAFMGIIGALGSGWLSDRLDRRKVMGAIVFTQALSLLVLLTATTLWQVIVFAVVFGIGQGAHAINRSMLGEYFGQTHYARLWGIISMATTPFAAVGPVFAGVTYDRTGSYGLFIITLIGVYVLAALAYYNTRRPAPPKVLATA